MHKKPGQLSRVFFVSGSTCRHTCSRLGAALSLTRHTLNEGVVASMSGQRSRVLMITPKAEQIRAAIHFQGKVRTNSRYVAIGQLRQHAEGNLISEGAAIAALAVFEDGTLGSGTPASYIKAFLDEGYLEEQKS